MNRHPIQTKPKVIGKGSATARQLNNKVQGPESKRILLSTKKEKQTKAAPLQKPGVVKAKDSRIPMSKNSSLTQKLNNINDVITRGIKRPSSRENLRTEKFGKGKTSIPIKNSYKAPSVKSPAKKPSWHSVLSEKEKDKNKTNKSLRADTSVRTIDDKFKEVSSMVSTIEVSTTDDSETTVAKGRAMSEVEKKTTSPRNVSEKQKNLKGEFEDLFRNLLTRATSEQQIYLEEQRGNFEQKYYTIALSNREAAARELKKSKKGDRDTNNKKPNEKPAKHMDVNPIKYVTPVWKPCEPVPVPVDPYAKKPGSKRNEDTIPIEVLREIQSKQESFQYLKNYDAYVLETLNSSAKVDAEEQIPIQDEGDWRVSPWNSKADLFTDEERDQVNCNIDVNENPLEDTSCNQKLEIDSKNEEQQDEKTFPNTTEIDDQINSMNEQLKKYEKIGKEKFSKLRTQNDLNFPEMRKSDDKTIDFLDTLNSNLYNTARSSVVVPGNGNTTATTTGTMSASNLLFSSLKTKPVYTMKAEIVQNAESNLNSLSVFQEKNETKDMDEKTRQILESFTTMSKPENVSNNNLVNLDSPAFQGIKNRFLPKGNSQKSPQNLTPNASSLGDAGAERPNILMALANVNTLNRFGQEADAKQGQKDDNQETSAQSWMKDFLNRMSKEYGLPANVGAPSSNENLALETKQSKSSESIVETVENDQETDIEVFNEQSDTQVLIQQLEYNIEQIRHGLTELGRQCENEVSSSTAKQPAFCIPLMRTLSAKQKIRTEKAIKCPQNFFPSSGDLSLKNLPSTNELATKKHVSWGNVKIDTFINPSPSPSNASSTASHQTIRSDITYTNSEDEDDEVEDEETVVNSGPHITSPEPDYDGSDDLQETDSINELELSDIDALDGNFSYSDIEDILIEDDQTTSSNSSQRTDPPNTSQKNDGDDAAAAAAEQEQPSQMSIDLNIPNYTGCECMLSTYKSIMKQVHDL